MSRKAKLILFWSIIALVILVLIFGRSLIFTGKIVINSTPPYDVEIIGKEIVQCAENPCVIRQGSGVIDLYLRKPEYQSVITRVDVGIWQKTPLDIEFKPFPKLLSAPSLPATKEIPDYSLEVDNGNGMQKLVSSVSTEPIVYFSRSLQDAQIFGSNDFVLAIDGDGQAYKIDVQANKRSAVNIGVTNILAGKWSLDGRYFVFQEKDSQFLGLIDTAVGSSWKLTINSSLDQVAWIQGGRLVFASDQAFSSEVEPTISGISLNFLGVEKGENYVFGFYNPANNFYEKVGDFSEIKEAPKNLTPTTSGSEIYFENGEKIYKVVTFK